MFKLVAEAGLNACFQCGEQIETVKSFSVEHKIPWLGESQELFWDLDNIAFSHLSCNSGARRKSKDLRGPDEGTKWCNACKQFKKMKDFRNQTTGKGKIVPATYCRDCANKKHNEYRYRVGLRKRPAEV